jgi:FkbM family methyltransferase
MDTGLVVGVAGVLLGGAALAVALVKDRTARRRARRVDRRLAHAGAELARVRRAVYAENARAALERAGKSPRGDIEFRAEAGEDALLWDLLGGQLDGFFIEAGAHDGYRISVSYAFERIGWTGLLVEAIPERVADCCRVRRGSRVEHAALGRSGATGKTTFTIADGAGLDVLSFHKAKSGHEAEIAQRGGTLREVQVPLTSLEALLKDHTGEIDFFSLDVEGAELDVLDGMGPWRPRILMVEDASAGEDGRLEPAVVGMGYVMAGWLGFNRVFVRKDQSEVLKRAEGLLVDRALYARG